MKSNPTSLNDTITAIKKFFVNKGFSEVKTPQVITSPFPEPHIDAVEVDGGYFRTSPELHMKILLAEGQQKIFEVGPCRRKHESGRIHREEFTMLEWYEVGADYNDLIGFTRELLLYVCRETIGSNKVMYNGSLFDFSDPPEIFTLNELFSNFANVSPEEALANFQFEELLTDKIEPQLPLDKAVIVKDYPAELAAFSKLKENDKSIAERWELYLGGVEIANTYTELTDPEEHLSRFAKFAKQRQEAGTPEYLVDPLFLKALELGIPDSAGCALGVDRLHMVLNSLDSI
ncbi:MAG: amino acid--tRNA ligase-related protein [Candidatus Theseobacter exili]|nr:amino acid--tRNA ligase-related protein [Candidatus Theseobacter exili]